MVRALRSYLIFFPGGLIMRPGFPRFDRGIIRPAGERWGHRRILGAYSSVAVALEHDIIRLPATGSPTDSPLLQHICLYPDNSVTNAGAFRIARHIRRSQLMVGYELQRG